MPKNAQKTPSVLGKVVFANEVVTTAVSPRQAQTIILFLAASVALMMTGFGIIMPVFARRLGEFGAGVEALGMMTMVFALAQFIASPVMGSLADKYGRKPLILLALASFVLVNIGYLLAPTVVLFISVRAFAGALTAGLFPSAMGVVADIIPEQKRAKWIGIVMAGYGVGFIFGPALGGFLYDGWGFAAPFVISAVMAGAALLAATILVPETRPPVVRRREALRRRRAEAISPNGKTSFWDSLPRPLLVLATLLFVDFVYAFAFAFVEPQMVFYMYDELGWTTLQFGIIVGGYGLAMVLGQTMLGQLSDRLGRKPVIALGILLMTTLYVGLTLFNVFWMMMIVAIVSGLGAALLSPAISAFYLDITSENHRSRVVGIKESALALGGVLGPLAVVLASKFMTPQGIFMSAAALTLLSLALTVAFLKEPERLSPTAEPVDWEIAEQRSVAAQASLRGVVLRANNSRLG